MFLVDGITREITSDAPKEDLLFGVTSDEKTNIKYFKCPRYTKNGVDLASASIRINYINGGAETDQYVVTDLEADEEYITFSWTLHRNVTKYKGSVHFIVCAVICDADGNITNEWNTTSAKGSVHQGIEVDGSQYEEETADAIESILLAAQRRIDAMVTDDTLSQAGVAADAAATGAAINQLTKELENDFSQLSEKKVNIPDDGYGTPLYGTSGQVLQTKGDGTTQWVNASGGSGLTEDLKSELKNFFANMQVLVRQIAYVTEENIGATLISNAHGVVNALDGTATEEPEVPEGVALVSISATYAGGEVNAGTDLTDLDGITVTATYSDGSNANVTKYTLIGEIAVGSNTITVIYGGLTTAFEVVGIKEILYQLSSQTTFDGTNNIDTGVSLLSTDSDWTVVADLESEETGEEEWVFHAINLKSPWEQFGLAQTSNKIWRVNYGATQQHQMSNLGTSCPNIKIVITHTTGNNYVDIKAIDKDGNYSGVYSGQCIYNSSVVFNGNIVIGSHMENKNYWKGVANDFKIYSKVLSDDEISAYLV